MHFSIQMGKYGDLWMRFLTYKYLKMLQLYDQVHEVKGVFTLIYAKCTVEQRLILWESLEDMTANVYTQWLVGGDFNVISNEEEKIGGLLLTDAQVRDFN